MSPRAADLIRKLVAGFVSVLITVLLFRVMFRAAHGRGSLADAEMWIALVLLTLGVVWVKAARRIQRERE
jgi:hypothetical protein